MPTNALAISEFGATLTKKVSRKLAMTASAPALDKDTKVVDADARDPIWSVDIEGLGTLPAGLITGAALTGENAVAGVTGGKSFINKRKYTQKNEGYDEWSASATCAPSAA